MSLVDTAATTASPAASTPTPSIAYRHFLRNHRRRKSLILGVQLLLLVSVFTFWQVGADIRLWDPVLTSTPSTVWTTFLTQATKGTIWPHIWVTLQETVFSFVAGMVLGIGIAVVIWWSPFISRVLDPYLVIANATPKVAFGPILFAWLGATWSVYGMAISISLIVTIMMVYTGFSEVSQDKVKLLRTFGASRRQVLTKVILPASVPILISTAKVCVGLTLVGVVMGEFLAASAGLGYLIVYGSQIFQMSLVMTSICVLIVLSALLYGAVSLTENYIVRRRPSKA
jgi:NitT/TauT family transport system permease protein